MKKPMAILRYKNKECIHFGGCELHICDNANRVEDCRTYLGSGFYTNQEYKNDEASYRKLNGNTNSCFKVKEWEVFQI
jgi:hypothetical protein